MKRKKNYISFLAIVAVLFLSMSSNYDDPNGKSGVNGSPGEQTCAKSGCHDSFAINSGTGSVSISFPDMPNNLYVPGQTYTVQVTVAQSGISLFGFGLEALLASGANGGTLNAGTGSHALNSTVSGNSRKTITQLENSGTSAGTHTWTFSWTAPVNGSDITFYAVGNAANGNGTDTGDRIYSTSQVVAPVPAIVTPVISYTGSLVLCEGQSIELSTENQIGAQFSWRDESNVEVATGNTFIASASGCYSVTATSGTQSLTSTNVCVVVENPDAGFTGLAPTYCIDQASAELVPVTVGGTFSGDGVNGNTFDPIIAGVGTHIISYAIVSTSGCESVSSQTVNVLESANSTFSGLTPVCCINVDAIQLIPAVVGGVFSGAGVSGDMFFPAVSGVGIHDISYTVDLGTCFSETTVSVEVLGLPEASFSGLDFEYCENTDQVSELSCINSPAVFSGPGVFGSTFNASLAGAGVHTIECSYTDANGCTGTSTQSVIVHALPSADVTVSGDMMSAIANEQGATYQWWNCDTQLQVDGATSAEFFITDPSQNGNYSVAVTLSGCDAMSECVLLLIESVEELEQSWSAGFYPNPATTNLTIWSSTPVAVSIYNSLGALVLSERVNAMNHILDITELQQGIYQVMLQTSNGEQSAQLLVKQ